MNMNGFNPDHKRMSYHCFQFLLYRLLTRKYKFGVSSPRHARVFVLQTRLEIKPYLLLYNFELLLA